MIGQEKLLKIVNAFTLENMPKTLLFTGKAGCGKHTLVNYLADRLLVPVVEVPTTAKEADIPIDELLNQYQQCPLTKIYLINLTDCAANIQNKLLKFIEEPSKTVYVICIVESEQQVLPTILNRCIKYKFADYTESELRQVLAVNNPLTYILYTTPGALLQADISKTDALDAFCNNFIEQLKIKNKFLLLARSNSLDYKNTFDERFNFIAFINLLSYKLKNLYLITKDTFYYNAYLHTVSYKSIIFNSNVSKETLFTNYLMHIEEALWK